jgi:hypothetical protein
LDSATQRVVNCVGAFKNLGTTSTSSIEAVISAAESLVSALGKSGSKTMAIIAAILAVLEQIGQKGLWGFVGNIVQSVGHAAGGVFDGIGQLFGIKGAGGIFKGADYSNYNEDVKKYEKLVSVWEDLISLKKEYLKTGYTEDIKQSEEEIKRLYALEIESAEGWNELLKWKDKEGISDSLYNSVKKGRMTGLFDLSVEQLKALKENAPTFFAQLDDDTQKYINQIINGSKSLSDALDEVKQKWTSTTVDELISGYSTALDSMDDMTKNFGNSITKTLRTAVINAFMQSSSMKPYIKGWFAKFDEYMENDGKLDDNEIQTLKNGSWTYYDTDSGKTITINGAKGLLDKCKNGAAGIERFGTVFRPKRIIFKRRNKIHNRGNG